MSQWRFSGAEFALTTNATGAAYPAVTSEVFERAEVLLPRPTVLGLFHEQVEPRFHHIAANNRENNTLARTRNYLLPKLLAGDIVVKATEEQVAAII